MKILIEIVLALVTIFCGINFWQIFRRDRFMRSTFANTEALKRALNEMKKSNAFESREFFPKPSWTDDYIMNIYNEGVSSHYALGKASRLMLMIAFVAGLASYFFLGFNYLLINLGLFIFPVIFAVQGSAMENAMEDIMSVAWNVYWFDKKNPKECKDYIEAGTALRPLYKALKELDK
jgi:hypothetical protein